MTALNKWLVSRGLLGALASALASMPTDDGQFLALNAELFRDDAVVPPESVNSASQP